MISTNDKWTKIIKTLDVILLTSIFILLIYAYQTGAFAKTEIIVDCAGKVIGGETGWQNITTPIK